MIAFLCAFLETVAEKEHFSLCMCFFVLFADEKPLSPKCSEAASYCMFTYSSKWVIFRICRHYVFFIFIFIVNIQHDRFLHDQKREKNTRVQERYRKLLMGQRIFSTIRGSIQRMLIFYIPFFRLKTQNKYQDESTYMAEQQILVYISFPLTCWHSKNQYIKISIKQDNQINWKTLKWPKVFATG